MTVARRLAALIRDGAGTELPVRIRAWDGTEAGPSDGPVPVIRNRRGLRRLLWAPRDSVPSGCRRGRPRPRHGWPVGCMPVAATARG
jgi:hypothetical protein